MNRFCTIMPQLLASVHAIEGKEGDQTSHLSPDDYCRAQLSYHFGFACQCDRCTGKLKIHDREDLAYLYTSDGDESRDEDEDVIC